MTQILDLLEYKPAPEPGPAQKSTLWVPDGPCKIIEPKDIKGCSCANMAPFATHISEDCLGLEMFNTTPKTVFGSPLEAIVALAHSAKGVLLGELRVCPVEAEGVLRLMRHDDPEEADKLYIAGGLRGGQRRRRARRSFGRTSTRSSGFAPSGTS